MGLSETLKKSLIAGIALIAPLVVTVVAVRLIFGWLRGILNPIIQETGLVSLSGNIEIVAELGALAILLLGITLLGYLAQRSGGARLFDLFDRLVGIIPMVSVVYSSVRQVSDSLVNRESKYESVVLVEYPREGLYVLGFVTSESPGAVTDALGREAYNVYVPNSPNPTQGRFMLVPTEDVIDIDMSVSRTVRLLVTTGIAEDQEELEQFQRDVQTKLDSEDISLDDVRTGAREEL
ncbi:DUF502 domain-containing protein [Salinibaculum salinum]|uniref:DUF502 domain-containing protein n=1 Tax=Salinibaculum salinum TaxID=3131996 RepID=UPI0030EB5239